MIVSRVNNKNSFIRMGGPAGRRGAKTKFRASIDNLIKILSRRDLDE